MARECPVCMHTRREQIFSMKYRVPDDWPLPSEITWYACDECGMIYGDGDFDQAMLDDYYQRLYGYGVNNPANTERLRGEARMIVDMVSSAATVVDFGGSGDDGESIFLNSLSDYGARNVISVNAGDKLPPFCDVIYASHVLEHIYDLPEVMRRLVAALAPGGTLIVDVPDALGLLQRWKMPILDYNTKHLNHFTMRNLLELGYRHGLEAVSERRYELEFAPCMQVQFRRVDVARTSAAHVISNDEARYAKLMGIDFPVNVWGMSDIVWHTLADFDLDVLDYIDNDPAYRGQTYNGKPVLERPTNDAPIVIMAQGQRGRLIENIRAMGVENRIIEV